MVFNKKKNFSCSRQACAVESAARWNPDRSVFVLSVSPVGLSSESISPMIRVLLSYPNVHFRNIDLKTYVVGTGAEKFVESGKLFESQFLVVHTSDLLRFVSLNKFGGIYLDLDMVVQKSFDHMPPNFACEEDPTAINNAVLGFQHNEVGKQITDLCIR